MCVKSTQRGLDVLANGKNGSRFETGSCLNQKKFWRVFFSKEEADHHRARLSVGHEENKLQDLRIISAEPIYRPLTVCTSTESPHTQCEIDTPMSGDFFFLLLFSQTNSSENLLLVSLGQLYRAPFFTAFRFKVFPSLLVPSSHAFRCGINHYYCVTVGALKSKTPCIYSTSTLPQPPKLFARFS